MQAEQLVTALKLELSVKAKNGLDFILAASLVWGAIAVLWTLPNSPARNSFLTFFVGALTLPLAWLFSKALRTTWTLPHNPLQPLGLWLNFAQLFYFPFLVFVFSKYPQHFIMTYGIITGGHFFPYAWLYGAKPYAYMAGVLSVGCLVLGLRLPVADLYLIPLFITGCLLVLGGLLLGAYRRSQQAYLAAAPAAAVSA